jgi:hypothetical protein
MTYIPWTKKRSQDVRHRQQSKLSTSTTYRQSTRGKENFAFVNVSFKKMSDRAHQRTTSDYWPRILHGHRHTETGKPYALTCSTLTIFIISHSLHLKGDSGPQSSLSITVKSILKLYLTPRN